MATDADVDRDQAAAEAADRARHAVNAALWRAKLSASRAMAAMKALRDALPRSPWRHAPIFSVERLQNELQFIEEHAGDVLAEEG